MYISKIELKNWRNFSAIDVDLSEKTVIIGPNASGKSNFLDALRFLRDLVREGGGLQSALRQRGGLSKIRSLSARRDNRVKICIELSEDEERVWRYELEFTQRGGGVVGDSVGIVTHESLIRFAEDAKEEEYIQFKSPTEEYLTRFTSLEQANENHKFREFAEFFMGISYLHIVPQLVRDPHSFVQKKDIEDYFGRDFISMLSATNQNIRKSYMNRISRFLHIAVPGFEAMNVEKDQQGEPHLVVEFKSWRGTNAKQNESQLSDGTLRLIGLLWSLQHGTKPVLLEEPELSLHPEIVKRLYQVISELHKNKKRRRQVVLTTHSYDFLSDQSIKPNEVVVLSVGNDGVSDATNLSESKDVKELLRSGFTVAETALPKTTPRNIDQLTLQLK